jgi:CRISPR/Cas system-associated exonuclease Cas4 (RecB family)
MNDSMYTPKELTALVGLVDTYKRWSQFIKRDDRRYDKYHPSEWGKCLRNQQYRHYKDLGFIEVEHKGMNSKILRLFDKGHNMHNRWVSYFDDMGGILRGQWKCKNSLCNMFDDNGKLKNNLGNGEIKKIFDSKKTRRYGKKEKCGSFKPLVCKCGGSEFEYIESSVKDESLNMSGHADLIIDCSNLKIDRFKEVVSTFDLRFLPTNNKKIVIDMKSIGSNQWRTQLERKGAHKAYIIQLTIYSYILDCEYGVLMYENKDNSQIKCYKIDKNDEWWEAIKWQATTMQNMVEDRKLPPPRPVEKSSYECKQCDFRSICHTSGIWKDPNLNKKRKSFYKVLL